MDHLSRECQLSPGHEQEGAVPPFPLVGILENHRMMSPEWRVLRARIAGKKRQDPNADVSEERRELRALRLEEHIRRATAEAPALTAEQARRLRALLAPTSERGTAA